MTPCVTMQLTIDVVLQIPDLERISELPAPDVPKLEPLPPVNKLVNVILILSEHASITNSTNGLKEISIQNDDFSIFDAILSECDYLSCVQFSYCVSQCVQYSHTTIAKDDH